MLQAQSSSALKSLQGNMSLLLDEEPAIWLVQSGTLVVFATHLDRKAQVKGDRQYLFTVEAGEVVIGMQSTDYHIVAVALEASTLQAIASTDLATKMTADPGFLTRIEGWINHWDEWLSRQSLTPSEAAEILTPAPRSRYQSLLKQQAIQADQQAIQWVKIQQGQVRWLDRAELSLESPSAVFPLTPHSWLTATIPTEVQLLSLAGPFAVEPGALESLIPGIQQFHRFLLLLLRHLEAQQRETEYQRFQERERLNQQILFNAMNELLLPLQPERVTLAQEGSPLLVAAGAVAHALNIDLRPPAASEDFSQVKNPLEAIARVSKFRTRDVQLVGEWWKREHGPLLAYTLAGQPIALLPQSRQQYIAFDPITLSRTPVDASVAKTLSSRASMFYRPLPQSITHIFGILEFATRGYVQDIVFIVLLGMVASLLGMLVPQATQILINDAIPNSDISLLLQLGLALLATAFGRTALGLTQGLLTIRVENVADSTLQMAIWDRLLQLPTAFFRRYSMGDLLTRMMAVNQIRQHLSGATQQTLLNAVFALLNLGLMLVYSIQLSAVAIGITIVTVAITTLSSVLLLRHTRKVEELSGKLNGLNVELINGVAKLRVAAAEDRAFGAWAKLFSQHIRLIARIRRIDDSITVVNEALPILSSVLMFWFITMLMQVGPQNEDPSMNLGSFLAFNAAFGIFLGGVSDLSNTVTDILNIIPLWERAKPILQTPVESTADRADPGRLSGHLRLDRVVFRYREDGPLILNDISLTAAPGEFIALVGPSGSGKSTLLRLLLGFEVPISGTVYYDGQDLAGLDVQAVRRQCGVVLQNGRIGAGSLFDNITGGALVALGQAWEAARMAGFAEDIEQMPMGMHTIISEGGTNLSGGQRQRLLIARAIVLRPKIILFDEATSALDNRTQAIVSESLDHLNATRIVIAHRLSTIRNADRIYVMESGRIVQTGTFEELVNQEGLFARLAARQLD